MIVLYNNFRINNLIYNTVNEVLCGNNFHLQYFQKNFNHTIVYIFVLLI